MRRMDGLGGGGLAKKNRGEEEKKKLEKKRNRQEQADADTRCSYPHLLLLLLSVLLWRTKMNERSGGPQGPNSSTPALSLTLQSSPFPSIPSILPPSLCPQQSLYSSVFISLPLPPTLTPSLCQLSCCYSL